MQNFLSKLPNISIAVAVVALVVLAILTPLALLNYYHWKGNLGIVEQLSEEGFEITYKGEEASESLTVLDLLSTKETVTDGDVLKVGGLVTQSNMDHVAALSGVNSLFFQEVTLRKVDPVSLPECRRIGIRYCQNSEYCVPIVASCPALEELLLYGEVHDETLKECLKTTDLRCLDLRSDFLTNAGLRRLASQQNLTSLIVDCPKVNSAGLKWLEGNPSITSISLRGCTVDDECLELLLSMKSVEQMSLFRTSLTESQFAWLSENAERRQIQLNVEPRKREDLNNSATRP